MTVRFRLLGSIEVTADDQTITLGHMQLRCMLTVLLVGANQAITVDELIDRIWPEGRLPRQPRRAVQHNIPLLRRALAPVPGVALTRHDGGYRLSVEPDTVDLHRFHALLAQARAVQRREPPGQDDQRAAELLQQALSLWRGEPFADLTTAVDIPWLRALRATLTANHRTAKLALTDIRLRQGRHTDLLAELAADTARHPFDEPLAAQYLLALYRSCRQAEALEHYHRLQRVLADELGTDPSPPLRQLHQRILTADPTLAVTASEPSTTRPLVPRQLPAPPRLFIGRGTELAQLDKQADAADAAVITAIAGAGGIGKTWLALHWAHQRLDRFPDGQLHVDLRGFDPTDHPQSPATAVRGFLEALGVVPAAVPVDPEAQIGLYRSLMAGKHMLVVLDNARDIAQVTPLLPGSPTCTVLITSRRHLTGLVATHGAHVLAVNVLPESEARHLLGRHLGLDRLAAEPQAVADLLAYCAGLPLALTIVAARAARHPDFPLRVLADELRDTRDRLGALTADHPATDLRAVFSWSYHALNAEAATVFGLLGHVPGPDIDSAAAASLAAAPVERVCIALRELENASLIQQDTPGRYRWHDLIHLHATDRAAHSDPEAPRRLVDFYLHTAFSAEQLLQPLLPPTPLGKPAPGCHPVVLADQETALAWFAVEYPNLQAAQRLAAEHGWPLDVWRLARTLTTFLYRHGRFRDALTVWQAGEAAAEQLTDPAIRSGTHQLLGAVCTELGQHADALAHLTLAAQADDTPDQAFTHHALGWLWSLRGDNQRALRHAADALMRYRALGMQAGEGRELTVMSWYRALLGDYDRARAQGEAALALARRCQLFEDEALSTGVLGYIALHTAQHTRARSLLEESDTLLGKVGNTYYQATALDYLGRAHHALGNVEATDQVWQRALQLYRKQHRTTEADDLQERLTTLVRPPAVMRPQC